MYRVLPEDRSEKLGEELQRYEKEGKRGGMSSLQQKSASKDFFCVAVIGKMKSENQPKSSRNQNSPEPF